MRSNIALLAVTLLAVADVASAQIVRNFTTRYTRSDRGNYLLIGNTLMTCPDSSSSCANARAGSGSVTNNQDFTMVPVDVDTTDPGANSSSATLALPSGATVRFAGLYFGATSSSAARGQARLRTPASATYNTVNATQLDASGTAYHAFVDVTSLVAAGGSGTYTVADVKATTGTNTYAGWALVVVYSNASEQPHNVTVFDGFASIASGGGSASTTVSGFVTPTSGTFGSRIGFLAYEGDFSSPGDSFRVNGSAISDALNAANNVFNSTIAALGAHVATKTPNYVNQLGVDVDSMSVSGLIANSATSATLQFSPGSDNYLPGLLVFATEVFQPLVAPSFVKSVTDLNGGAVAPGDVLEYTLSASNTGNDGANAVILRDPIPAGTTYVPGSLHVVSGANAGAKSDASGDDQAEYDAGNARVVFRLGTGATAAAGGSLAPSASTSVRFRVQIGGATANGSTISNVASLDYTENQLGGAVSVQSNTASITLNVPDLTIAKTHSPSTFVRGSTGTCTVTVSNAGAGATSGVVTMSDTLPAGLAPTAASGTGWSCGIASQTVTCTRSDALAIGASYPAVAITVSVSQTAASPLTNTATVSGGSQTNTANDSASDPTPVTSSADLSLTKTGPASVLGGNNVAYTVTVTNNGPSDAAAVSVADPTPSGLSFVSNTGDCTTAWPCSLGTIPAGQSRTITSTFFVPVSHPAPSNIVNTATVSSTTSDPASLNDSASATTVVQPSTDLSISKTGPASVIPGTNVAWTVVVSNLGGMAASAVTVADPTPSGLSFVSNTGDCTTAWPCSLGTIPAGQTRTITSTFAVPAPYTSPDPIQNTATVSTTTLDSVAGNNSSTSSVSVTPRADLGVVKTGPASVAAGTSVVYTTVVTNHGPSDASGVAVADPTPAGLTFVSNAGDCTTAFPCALGSLAAGATRTITTTYAVPASYTTPNPIQNTATVSSSTTDTVGANDSSTASTPVTFSADLALAKTGPASATAGANVVYTITVTNNGTSDAQAVSVADPTPAGLSFVSNAGDCTTAFPCALGTVPAGATRTITSMFSVPASYTSPDPIGNTATVSSATTDPVPGNDSATTNTPLATSADLEIAKTGPASATAGANVVYTITVTNHGASDAQAVSVADPTPAGLSFVSNTGDCTTAFPCALGTVSAGATRTITSTFSVPASYTSPDPIGNTATVSSATTDPNAANDSATTSTPLATSADLDLEKTGPASVVAGTEAVYTITVTNDGISDAQAVTVSDPTPAGLVFVSNSGDCTSTFPCALGTLAPGASRTITATFAVPASYAGPSPFLNTATVSSATPDPAAANDASSVSTTVTTSADLGILKLAPAAVITGTNLVVTVLVTNHGTSDAQGVTVSDPTPPGLTFVSNTGDCTTAYPCALGTVAAGATRTITSTYAVPPSYTTPDPIVNTASVSSTTGDPNAANDSSSTSTEVTILDAELEITKSGPAEAVPGTNLVYTVVVTNHGPDDAPSTTVADPTPSGLSFVSNTGDCTTAYPCSLGTLPAGQSRTITTTYAVPAGYTTPDPIRNVAFVTSNVGDSDGTNNTATVDTPVVASADLSLAKSGPASVVAGQDVVYTITLANDGSSDARSVVVDDPTPPGLVFVSNTGDCATPFPCALGTVPASATRTITATFTVPSSHAAPGPILNTASVSSATADPDGDDNDASASTTVTTSADLAITKTGPATATPGQDLVYTVTVTNGGSSDAESVMVADPTPAGLGFVSNTGDCTTAFPCALGTLPAGATRTITTTLSVPASYTTPAPIVNTATVSSATSDPDGSDDSSTTSTPVVASADLAITKTAPASATPGEDLVYTIVVTNEGSSDAPSVSVADPTPAGLTFVSNTGDCTTAFPCALGTVPSGATRTITATFSVAASYTTPDPIVNTATVSSAAADPVAANDSSTTSTPVMPSADLAVASSAAASVAAGTNLVYTITVTNDGSSDAAAVSLAHPTPAGLTFVSNAGDCTTAFPCSLGTVEAGGTRTITATYAVPSSYTTPSPIEATATVSSSTADPDGSNDSATASTAATTSADLAIAKSDATDPVEVGTPQVYTIQVTNLGPSDATGVVVTDTLDAETTHASNTGGCSHAAGTLTCNVGALAAGASASFTVTANVHEDAPVDGTLSAGPCNGTEDICNTATVTAVQPDPDAANNTATEPTDVEAPSVEGLTLAVTDSPDAVVSGGALTYVLTYSNAGTSNISNAVLTVSYDARTTFVSASPAPGSGTTQWNLGTLSPGESGQITIQVATSGGAADGDVLLLEAELDGSRAIPAAQVETTTVRQDAADRAAVTVTKTVSPAVVRPGGLVTWTVVVANAGPATAYGVVLSDDLPAGVDYLSASPVPDAVAGAALDWSVGDLEAGQSRTFVVYGEAGEALAAGTLLENVASAAGTTGPGTTASAGLVGEGSVVVAVSGAAADCGLVMRLRSTGIAMPGGEFVYRLLWQDACENAPSVTITHDLPPEASFVSASGGDVRFYRVEQAGDHQRVILDVGDLQPGRIGAAFVRTRLADGVAPGTELVSSAGLADAATRSLSASDSSRVRDPGAVVITRSFLRVTGQIRAIVDTTPIYSVRYRDVPPNTGMKVTITGNFAPTSFRPEPTEILGTAPDGSTSWLWRGLEGRGIIKIRGLVGFNGPAGGAGVISMDAVALDDSDLEIVKSGRDIGVLSRTQIQQSPSANRGQAVLKTQRFARGGRTAAARLRYRMIVGSPIVTMNLPSFLEPLFWKPEEVASIAGNTFVWDLMPAARGVAQAKFAVPADLIEQESLAVGATVTDDFGTIVLERAKGAP